MPNASVIEASLYLNLILILNTELMNLSKSNFNSYHRMNVITNHEQIKNTDIVSHLNCLVEAPYEILFMPRPPLFEGRFQCVT